MKKLLLAICLTLPLTACMSPGETGATRNAPTYETRTIAVLSNEPHDLRLCDSSCETIVSFDNVSWTQTGHGYETTIRVSSEVFYGRNSMTLMRADDRGWSDWGSAELRYLRSNDVTSSDPACVGGRPWCATRGL